MFAHNPTTLAELPSISIDLESIAMRTYPTPFIHIERWSKVWGCLPITYSYPNRCWRMSPFLTFWVLCSIGFNVPCFYDCLRASVGGDNSITLYVMVLIVMVMSISAVTMHVLSLIHYDKWGKFLESWMIFERKFRNLTTGVHSFRLAVPLYVGFLICVTFFVVNILNELRFNLINNDGVWRMLSLVYVYVIYSFTLSMPILWVVMASKVFAHCLCHIRRELESILECAKFGETCTLPVQKCIAEGDISRLQDAVLELRRIIKAFKAIMGPFMLVIIPHHIISLICFLYWTLVSTLDYSDWYFPLSFGLLSIQAIAPIFCGAIYSEEVQTQKNSLIEPLLMLKGTLKEEEAKVKMAALIDHVSRTDAQIEGCGFFILNKGMASTVVNTVVTYLVVLIQFYGSGR
ncbi:putative gustatory receptor 39b [Homarus americanus]|uniref:putative gustatory receptor 39b n=1 Tax=Homarus americanus TaxID=6706 RepID=UPI001C449A19|nr:putative gustatory receptor 39b [Homarus americanus]